MNRIERVRAALRGEPVDHVPVGFWTHFAPEVRTGRPMAAAHLEFHRATGGDFLKVMNDNPYRLVGVDRITTPSDWRRLRPTPPSSAAEREYLDGLKAILDEVGDETMVIATVFNAFAIANDNHRGVLDGSDLYFDTITAHLRQDPASTTRGLAVIAESTARFAEACIAAGASGIFFSANGGDRNRFGPDEFEHLVASSDRVVLEASRAAGSEFDVLHVCGADQRLESYARHPAHAVNWCPQMGNPTLTEGRSLFAGAVLGGLDHRGALATGPVTAIADEVGAVLDGVDQRGLLLGAGCAVVGTPPTDHFVAAREAAITRTRS